MLYTVRDELKAYIRSLNHKIDGVESNRTEGKRKTRDKARSEDYNFELLRFTHLNEFFF
jgi:hypothetical protein